MPSSGYTVAFLAARSPVFRDMLAFPQPPDSELIDGCPVVLHALPDNNDIQYYQGCLRLANKYGVDYIYERALSHLSSGYATTLSRWDLLYEAESNGDRLEKVSWDIPDEFTSMILVIELIREVNALWLLPDAFYCLGTNFKGLRNEIIHGGTYEDEPTSLSAQDQEAFFNGYELQTRATTTVMRFLSYPRDIQGCTTSSVCHRERLAAINNFRGRLSYNPAIPLGIWRSTDWALLKDVCPTCRTVLEMTYRADRQAVWDKLPQIYGLPPWAELEKMKVAAVGTIGILRNFAASLLVKLPA
ncbi:hypothetical protein B0H14DRAFT_3889153 [Mycena olivaceomarginata]|nr:hypothetical protein B0H14DRAFT_3889153 [Mycena olivaceomarginata]